LLLTLVFSVPRCWTYAKTVRETAPEFGPLYGAMLFLFLRLHEIKDLSKVFLERKKEEGPGYRKQNEPFECERAIICCETGGTFVFLCLSIHNNLAFSLYRVGWEIKIGNSIVLLFVDNKMQCGFFPQGFVVGRKSAEKVYRTNNVGSERPITLLLIFALMEKIYHLSYPLFQGWLFVNTNKKQKKVFCCFLSVVAGKKKKIWLILPVIICFSQGLKPCMCQSNLTGFFMMG